MTSKDDKSSFEILCELYRNNPDILRCLNNIMVSWEKAQMWENIDVKWEDADIFFERWGAEWDFDCILQDIKNDKTLQSAIASHLDRYENKTKKLNYLLNDYDALFHNQMKQEWNIILKHSKRTLETGKINSELVEQNMIFTKVDDWSYFNVYLKSDIRYIRFEYPPNCYNNNTLKTNKLKAGDTKFTGSRGSNLPYKIIKHFIDNERFERFDYNTEYSRAKSISRLNEFFKDNFQNSINPIVKDEDGIYGYITSINFQYEK